MAKDKDRSSGTGKGKIIRLWPGSGENGPEHHPSSEEEEFQGEFEDEEEEGEEEEDEEEEGEKLPLPERLKKLVKMPAFWVGVVFLVLVAAVAIHQRFFTHTQATGFTENWTVEMKENNFSQFLAFGDNMIKFDRDGASYYNASGEQVWAQGFEMTSPFAAKNGNSLVIADRKGTQFYLFSTSGLTGSGSVNLPISKATISGNGVAALILEDTTANYIQFIAPDGSLLDIEIKTILSGDGYPVDVALSEDGTILAASYVFLSAGTMQNKVVFYNFSESGKNMVQRIVGGFEQYGSSIVADVEFLSQKQAVAFADDRVTFYSLRNEVSPEIATEVMYEREIKSIFTGNGYVGIVTDPEGERSGRCVDVFNASGSMVCSLTVDLSFTDAQFSGRSILFNNEYECRIYTLAGELTYDGPLSGTIVKVVSTGGSGLVQVGGQVMKKLTLR